MLRDRTLLAVISRFVISLDQKIHYKLELYHRSEVRHLEVVITTNETTGRINPEASTF